MKNAIKLLFLLKVKENLSRLLGKWSQTIEYTSKNIIL